MSDESINKYWLDNYINGQKITSFEIFNNDKVVIHIDHYAKPKLIIQVRQGQLWVSLEKHMI